jgi:hypothetical protein
MTRGRGPCLKLQGVELLPTRSIAAAGGTDVANDTFLGVVQVPLTYPPGLLVGSADSDFSFDPFFTRSLCGGVTGAFAHKYHKAIVVPGVHGSLAEKRS